MGKGGKENEKRTVGRKKKKSINTAGDFAEIGPPNPQGTSIIRIKNGGGGNSTVESPKTTSGFLRAIKRSSKEQALTTTKKRRRKI